MALDDTTKGVFIHTRTTRGMAMRLKAAALALSKQRGERIVRSDVIRIALELLFRQLEADGVALGAEVLPDDVPADAWRMAPETRGLRPPPQQRPPVPVLRSPALPPLMPRLLRVPDGTRGK